MPEVTGLRERGGRVRVYVDGEFYAEVDALVAEERGLVEGFHVPEDELREICNAGERALAMRRAFNLISYRERSRGEVRERLVSKHEHSEEVVEGVIGRLVELGYLDDVEFARSAARQKAERYGPRRIAFDLERAGLSKELVARVVEEEFSSRDEMEEARRAVDGRYNSRAVDGGDAISHKVYGFLTRRGYSSEVCAEVASEYRAGNRKGDL